MIDDLARELARPMPRRRALRLLGGAVAVAVVPGLRAPVAAAASCGALGCSGKCCSSTDWRIPGLQGVCCDVDEVCCGGGRWEKDPDHTYGWCCPAGQACGAEVGTCKASCKAPMFECGENCCNEDAACCPVDSEDFPICCPDGHDCVKQITPGNAGITPDSPYVCCPPEQLVTALTVSKICCPPGSVTQPGGGLSTAGGLCCTSGNVCAGRDCCDSTPSFPKECVNGRCEFEFLEIEDKSVKTERDGTVKVPVTMKQAHPATVSVVMAGASGSVAADAARKPVVLGRRKLAAKRGKRTVRIKLSRRGRKLLRKRGKLRVEIIVAVRDAAGKAETATPVTLRRR
jgi:hypothetical protein